MKKKILILNLTRMGDLLQTTPLIAGIKEENPDSEITLLGNARFISVCEHVPNIDELIVFDVRRFEESPDVPILELYDYLDAMVETLKGRKFDVLVNLSHSLLTAALGRTLGISEVRGFYSTPDGYRLINDPWLIYFSAFLSFRKINSLNLADIYQLGGGVKPKGRGLLLNAEKSGNIVPSYLEKIGIRDGDKVIGIQAGSSLKERRWPPENFAKAADIIARKRGAKVLLFGAESEKELGDKVESAMEEPCINLLGKTSLEELIGLVNRCELLITNDTGTMHIAAAVGTPSVALFLVHAYGAETGPYSEGNIILEPEISCFPCRHNTECPHYACLEYVAPEDAAKAADIILDSSKDSLPELVGGEFAKSKPLYSFFDQAGFMDLKPLKKTELSDSDIFSAMYRHFLVSSVVPGLADSYWLDRLEKNGLLWSPDKTEIWISKQKENFGKLASAANRGIKTILEIEKLYKKRKVEKAKALTAEILAIDSEIEILGNAHQELKPLSRLFELGKENLSGTDTFLILGKTKELYKGILTGAAAIQGMFIKFIKKTQAEKPGGKFVESSLP